MKLKIYQIDAFTDEIFSGNYAAVVMLEEWVSTKLMQFIANENNLSETAFVKNIHANKYEIRWFSPLKEIDFCGHATLAASFVLFAQYGEMNEITFLAKAVGELSINRLDEGYIQMKFPNQKPTSIDIIPQPLLDGLSITPQEVLRNKQAYFVIYASEDDIVMLEPNMSELKKLAPYDVVVTSKSTRYDFISRYFWPSNGGDEDPVTGSIHTGLAPLWAEKLSKNDLLAYQASKRGGVLKCTVMDDMVIISGKAVQYLEGEISV